MKINFEVKEFFPLIEVFNGFLKLYKLIANHNYIYFVRLFSDGDGKLHLVANNLDIKIKFKYKIEEDLKIDKIYSINELYNILKSMDVYPFFELDFKTNIIRFGTDAHFLIQNIDIEEKMKEELFNIHKTKVNKDCDLLKIDEIILKEFKNIKLILNAKNNNFPNYYFYKDDFMIFNLFNIYIKKHNNLININSDIIGFKFITYLFEKKFDDNIKYDIVNNKFIFKCESFYLEGKNCIFNHNDRQNFLFEYFEKFAHVGDISFKLEFFNFVSTVFNIDKNCCLVFDNEIVKVQSSNDEMDASFKLDGFKGFFVIQTNVLIKILTLLINYFDSFEKFSFAIGESNNTKWLKTECKDIVLLTEVMASLDQVNEDGVDEEDIFEESEE